MTLQNNLGHIIGFSGLTLTEFDGRQTLTLDYRFATKAWGPLSFPAGHSNRGFTHLNHQEITAVVREHHFASRRVLEKVGMYFYGKVNDVENAPASPAFSLTADRWFAERAEIENE
ncbi:GNAT family N-acetyltransferase [Chimaeribacter arupi]|nr:GNAT family N-acetyltransferase [Chimaeribacter arupi]MDV5142020.1 GNAT family N-acetyltransferase [Chimaeribacter arupi]